MFEETTDRETQLIRLRGMLVGQYARLEAQYRGIPLHLPSVERWKRLIKATERRIQELESQAPQNNKEPDNQLP